MSRTRGSSSIRAEEISTTVSSVVSSEPEEEPVRGVSSVASTKPEGIPLYFLENIKRIVKREVPKEVRKEVREEANKVLTRTVELLAIFVAFFTFVSIEFQLAKQFNYLQFLHFSLFFGGILMGFILLLDLVTTKEISIKLILFEILAILTIGVGFKYLSEVKIPAAELKDINFGKLNVEEVEIDPLEK